MAKKTSQFGSFTARPAAVVDVVDRRKYAGLTPNEAAHALMVDYAARRPLRQTTFKEKQYILKRLLNDLAQKGHDVSTVTTTILTELRDYIAVQVEDGIVSQNYAANLTKEWNAAMGCLFGDKAKAGEGLRMRGFGQKPRKVQVLTVDEIDSMIQQIPNRRWIGELNAGAMATYLEVAQSTAARNKSIRSELATFKEINWEAGTMRLLDVKNVDTGDFLEVVLTPRAVDRLRAWEHELRVAGKWQGPETPIMMGERGVLTYQSISKALKSLAGLAGINKPVTTHVIRKSTATHMARFDPKLAREQLGITKKVFDLHYDQPQLVNRIEHRDIIPGATSTYAGTESRIGALTMKYRRGELSEAEYETAVSFMERQDALKPAARGADPSIA